MQLSPFLFLCLAGCASSNFLPVFESNDEQTRAAISGGVLASPGDFPYVVFLMLTNGMFVSGGSLIGPYHVLTSAQGLLIQSSSFITMLRVTLNSLSTYGGVGAILLPVSRIIRHEFYNATTLDNNLALVVLSSPVNNVTFATLPVLPTTILPSITTTFKTPTSTTIIPTYKIISRTTRATTTMKALPTTKFQHPTSQIPSTTTKTTVKAGVATKTTAKLRIQTLVSQNPLKQLLSAYANMSAVIAGWGRKTPGGLTAPLLLKKVNSTILDNQSCTIYYGNNTFFGTDMLCASTVTACLDDTGSPILVDGIQVGITMWGTMCNSATVGNYSGIFIRVSTYIDWITKTVADNPGPVVG